MDDKLQEISSFQNNKPCYKLPVIGSIHYWDMSCLYVGDLLTT